ncbi:cytochrome P450 [Cerioporus squamosus]|nr:cytochrome P450 [Cerioporus squamosus]
MSEGSSSQGLTLALLLLAVFLLRKFIDFRRAAQSVNNLPGFRTLFSDRFVWFPFRVKGISPGLQSEVNLYRKYKDFEEAGWDIMSGVNFLPSSEVTLYLADPAVVKDVVGARSRFPKPMGPYKILLAFGPNLVASEGEEWKRQRKLVAPAFSEKNNRLVWDETVHIMQDLFDSVWGDKDVVEVSNATELTVPITLMVISVAGFGRRISWNEDAIAPAGHHMTFKDALNLVSRNLFLQLLFPKWMLRWGTPVMRRFAIAQDELQRYMQEMITARRDADIKEERHDLFSSLLDANEGLAESGEKLTDTGLMGNVFIFMVAAKYWDDPDTFNPARFLRDYPRDAFLPFSGGPRGCIGRGFSETESIAVLTLLVLRYRVEPAHEPQFAAETFEQRRARLLRSKLSVTL